MFWVGFLIWGLDWLQVESKKDNIIHFNTLSYNIIHVRTISDTPKVKGEVKINAVNAKSNL